MEELPRQCNYLPLAAARVREIKSIVSKLENCEHGGRVFQKLPRHMQRRAVSSNPRRLPRYLRDKHMREGGGSTKPSHRPRRKYRRRPANLLQEYNRRQKEHVWLETHLWHAKRFHMHRRWGYALPHTPTCRGHRASLRAATTRCLLQDVSYLCCIEVEGVKSTMLEGLSRVLQPESVSVLTSPQVLEGRRWVSCMFFQPGRQPHGALGEVDVLFHPSHHNTAEEEEQEEKERINLWIWTHPSAHTNIVEALAEIFHLEKVSRSSDDCDRKLSGEGGDGGGQEEVGGKELRGNSEPEECKKEGQGDDVLDVSERKGKTVPGKEGQVTQETNIETEESKTETHATDQSKEKEENEVPQNTRKPHMKNKAKKTKNINEEKLQTRNVPFERTPKYLSGDGNTTMTLLKDTLNRFRLLGPRAYTVLSCAVVPASVTVKEEEEEQEVMEGMNEGEEVKGRWWKQYYSEEGMLQNHQQQIEAWKQLASCTHPPGKVVLPLTVRDPRVTLPNKKVPMQDEDTDSVKLASSLEWPVQSAMYNSEFRDQVTFSKEPEAALNQRRSQFLVPGSQLPQTPQEGRLPLLLLSRPPSSAGIGSGWEVVAPAGWGMSVFLPLVFNGGVVNGQREAENLHLEALTALPPHLLPDTPAGDLHSTWLAAERHKEFFKRPPASRHNYIKLGVQFPFSQPWRKLLQEWQPGVLDLFVLRDSRLIHCLSQLIKNVKKITSKMDEKDKVSDDPNIMSTDSKTIDEGKTKHYSSSNGNTTTSIGTKPAGKRKADGDMSNSETKRAKHEQSKEKIDTEDTERRNEETDGIEELVLVSPGCLVMVKLVLAHKGTMEPCAMVCLPNEQDLCPENRSLKLKVQGEAVEEPLHEDPNHDRRAAMRKEHAKILGRMRRVRRKARQKVTQERDFVSATHTTKTVKDATTEALAKVHKDNEAILKKYSSYKEEMESAWLMSASEPLQCCARPIIGYITHGTFSYTQGKAAGIGWVVLKPLLRLLDQCREGRGQSSSLLEASSRGKSSASIPVLVRNPSTLQYRWAHLSVVESTSLMP